MNKQIEQRRGGEWRAGGGIKIEVEVGGDKNIGVKKRRNSAFK